MGVACWALLGLALLALACGRAADPSGRADLPGGPSAFRLEGAPETVTHSLPLEYFRKGVPREDPRDAIPALFDPVFAPAAEARFLPDDTRVVVLEIDRDARAYPLIILDRHELVNDRVGGRPVLVSWCPLCGSAVAYAREIDGRLFTFGVSGYLLRSDVLMYDQQTESFWSQLHCGAVAGPMTGTPLEVIPTRVTSLDAFRRERPAGRVLRGASGMLPAAAYRQSPYADYPNTPAVWFPVGEIRAELPVKAEVIGLTFGADSWCWSLDWIRAQARQAPQGVLSVVAGARPVRIAYDAAGDAVRVTDEAGAPLAAIRLYWFAWQAFHPTTKVIGRE